MVSENIFIDAGNKDASRPSERPPKSNWKRELLILVCRVLQYPFPDKIADIFWEHFRKPQKAVFTEPQKKLIRRAKMSPITYKNCKIVHFQWGQSDRKVLLSHGWNSKIADFRRMIEHLEEAGFQVEGIDMKAHGKSEGNNTALPEIIDILKNFYQKKGPYDAVIGYSIGGLGAGLMTAEVPAEIRPQHLIMIAAPPYTTFLFKRTIKDLGFRNKVYEKVAMLLERTYGNPINHYDVRHKGESFSSTQLTFVYDEDDQTIPFEKGLILKDHYPEANFIHTKGLGHYNVITYPPVIEQIRKILTD